MASTREYNFREMDQAMKKTMHQVVLFMEEQEETWKTPLKIGNLFFNRFGADEDAAFESVGVYYLQKSSDKMAEKRNKEYANFENERKEKEWILIIFMSEIAL